MRERREVATSDAGDNRRDQTSSSATFADNPIKAIVMNPGCIED
jgi:hypothetical protein